MGAKNLLRELQGQSCRSVPFFLPIRMLHGLICLLHDMSGRFTDLLTGHPGIDRTLAEVSRYSLWYAVRGVPD